MNDKYWPTEKAAPIYTAENNVKQLKKWDGKVSFSYYLQKRKLVWLFKIILYRAIFGNFRELVRRLGLRIDERMERIDRALHRIWIFKMLTLNKSDRGLKL